MKRRSISCRLAVTLFAVVVLLAVAVTPLANGDGGDPDDGKYSIELILINSQNDDEQLTGATFEVYDTDVNGDKMGDAIGVVTDADGDGSYHFTGLSKKKYIIVETFAPAGYVRYSAPLRVNLEMLDGADTRHTMEIKNDPEPNKQYGLSVKKVSVGTATALTGAQFDLYDADGSGDMGNRLGAFTEIAATGEYEYHEALKNGIYYVVETRAPDGYVLNTAPRKVEIDGTQDVFSIEIENTSKAEVELPTNPPVYPSMEPPAEPSATPPAEPAAELPAELPIDPPARPNPPTAGVLVPDDNGNFTELDENNDPLGKWIWDEDLGVWVFESEIPLVAIPDTGDREKRLIPSLISAAALVGIALIRPRKRENER